MKSALLSRGIRWPFLYAWLMVLAFWAICHASCPLLAHSDPDNEREFQNVCQTISATAQNAVHFWVSFIDNAGTVSVNSSYNVASVVRASAGNYTINLSKPFLSSKYAVIGSAKDAGSGVASLVIVEVVSSTWTSVVTVNPTTLAAANTAGCYVSGFGN